jgi:hypothetical protein
VKAQCSVSHDWGRQLSFSSPFIPILARELLSFGPEVAEMRYMFAWLLGVPFSVIVLWFLFSHACAR